MLFAFAPNWIPSTPLTVRAFNGFANSILTTLDVSSSVTDNVAAGWTVVGVASVDGKASVGVGGAHTITVDPVVGPGEDVEVLVSVKSSQAGSAAQAFLAILTVQSGGATFPEGYGYRQRWELQSRNEHSQTATGIVVFVKTTQNALKLVANGGRMTRSDGGDLMFTMPDGTKIPHEVYSYTGTTGEFKAYVRIPEWDCDDDLELSVYYGNNGLAGSASDPTGCWADYFDVYHLPRLIPAKGVFPTLTANGALTTVSSGIDADNWDIAANRVASAAAPSILNGKSALTVQAWVKSDVAGTAKGFLAIGAINGADDTQAKIGIRRNTGDGYRVRVVGQDRAYVMSTGNNVASTTALQQVAVMWGGNAVLDVALNGVLQARSGTPTTATSNGDALANVTGNIYLGASTRDTVTAGWDGLFDEIRFRSQRLTPAFMALEQKLIDDSSNNWTFGAEETPAGSVLSARGSTVTVLKGQSTVVDVVAAAVYSGNRANLTASISAPSSNVAASVATGRITLIPNPTFVGTATVGFTLTDGSLSSSAAITIVVTTGGSTSDDPFAPWGDFLDIPLGDPGRVFTVSTAEGLRDFIAIAGATDHIIIRQGAKIPGDITINRKITGGNVTILAEKRLESGFQGNVTISAEGWRLHGLEFYAKNGGGPRLTINADQAYVDRCRFMNSRNLDSMVDVNSQAKNDVRFFLNEIGNFDGRAITVNDTFSREFLIYNNYIHDQSGTAGGERGSNAVFLGTEPSAHNYQHGTVVRNIFQRINSHGALEIKGSDVPVLGNLFDGAGAGGADGYVRHGSRCTFYGNYYANGSNMGMRGWKHKILCNVMEEGSQIILRGGTIDPEPYEPNHPSKASIGYFTRPIICESILAGNNGRVKCGEFAPGEDSHPKKARDNSIYDHTGSIYIGDSGAWDAPSNRVMASAPYPSDLPKKITPRKLTNGEVGPNGKIFVWGTTVDPEPTGVDPEFTFGDDWTKYCTLHKAHNSLSQVIQNGANDITLQAGSNMDEAQLVLWFKKLPDKPDWTLKFRYRQLEADSTTDGSGRFSGLFWSFLGRDTTESPRNVNNWTTAHYRPASVTATSDEAYVKLGGGGRISFDTYNSPDGSLSHGVRARTLLHGVISGNLTATPTDVFTMTQNRDYDFTVKKTGDQVVVGIVDVLTPATNVTVTFSDTGISERDGGYIGLRAWRGKQARYSLLSLAA